MPWAIRETEKKLSWKILNATATALAVVITQHGLGALWKRLGGRTVPEGPAGENVTLPAALIWAVALGVGVAVSRLIAIRLAVDTWEAVTHQEPPDPTVKREV
jgi:hypothetical protein